MRIYTKVKTLYHIQVLEKAIIIPYEIMSHKNIVLQQ